MGSCADSRGRALLALVCVAALALPQAASASGNGLYEPFPEAAVKERAERYVERLRGRIPARQPRFSEAQLTRGTFVRADRSLPALAPVGAAATGRSGGDAEDGMPVALQVLLLLAVLAIPFGLVAGRAPPCAA